jgi:hypothetical protein
MNTKLVRLFVDSKTNHVHRTVFEATDEVDKSNDFSFMNGTHWMVFKEDRLISSMRKLKNGFDVVGNGILEFVVPLEEEPAALRKIKVMVKKFNQFQVDRLKVDLAKAEQILNSSITIEPLDLWD